MAKAVYWYEKAASQNIAEALHSLGVFYDEGKGVPVDAYKTFEYYRKSQKKWRLEFLSSPAILKRILNLKTQNFDVKSNSENRFTFRQKNSEWQKSPL